MKKMACYPLLLLFAIGYEKLDLKSSVENKENDIKEMLVKIDQAGRRGSKIIIHSYMVCILQLPFYFSLHN